LGKKGWILHLLNVMGAQDTLSFAAALSWVGKRRASPPSNLDLKKGRGEEVYSAQTGEERGEGTKRK